MGGSGWDEAMRTAIAASERSRGTTSPNPPVGCVVLDADGAVTGVKVTVHADTPGVGTKNMEPSYLSQYSGISELTSASDVKKESAELASGGSFAFISGASVTGQAIHSGVDAALSQYAAMGGAQ